MDLIFRHINLVRMEKEIMNEKYLIKGVCVSVAYIIYLSLCALVTTDERLLALIHILTLVLIFVASKRYITFEKTGIKLIAMSIVLGIGMALSFTVIVPFANDVGEAQSYSMREIFYYVNSIFLLPIMEELIFRGIIFKELVSNYPLKFAIVSSSLIWMLAHLNPLNAGVYFLHAVLMAYTVYLTSNILYPILMHVSINSFNLLGGTNSILLYFARVMSEPISIFLTIVLSVGIIAISIALIRKLS